MKPTNIRCKWCGHEWYTRSAFKITGGKKHEHHIDFFPSAKLIFSCNIIPTTSNKDLAFYRRWIILEFNKQTMQTEIDKELKSKLRQEMPGILNWAIEGLKRLEEQKNFTYRPSPEDVKDLYEKASDSINSYIYKNISCSDDESVVLKRDVYADYANYCNNNRLRRENPMKFGREFLATTGCGTTKKSNIPAYIGVRFKTIDETKRSIDDYVD